MKTESSGSGLYILGDSTTFIIELKHHWRDSGSGYYNELEDEDSYNFKDFSITDPTEFVYLFLHQLSMSCYPTLDDRHGHGMTSD